jgi:CheY-like chemotaxis protein
MGGRIYVVEDDTDIQCVLVEALECEGYDATGYDSGIEALAAIERQPPDLLITDLAMPGMRGEELVTRVRSGKGAADEGTADASAPAGAIAELPIMIISATANARAVAQLPVQAFIGKPFELAELLAEVEHWCRAVARAPAFNPARQVS